MTILILALPLFAKDHPRCSRRRAWPRALNCDWASFCWSWVVYPEWYLFLGLRRRVCWNPDYFCPRYYFHWMNCCSFLASISLDFGHCLACPKWALRFSSSRFLVLIVDLVFRLSSVAQLLLRTLFRPIRIREKRCVLWLHWDGLQNLLVRLKCSWKFDKCDWIFVVFQVG